MPQAACQLRVHCGHPLQVFGIVIIPRGCRCWWVRPCRNAAQLLGYGRREQRKEQAAARLADDTSWRHPPAPPAGPRDDRRARRYRRSAPRSRDFWLGEARQPASLLTIGIVTGRRGGSSRARSIFRVIWRTLRSKIHGKSEESFWRQIFQQHVAEGKIVLRRYVAANMRNWRSIAGERQSRSPIAPSRKMPERSSP